MATNDKSARKAKKRPKVSVQARVDADVVEVLDKLGKLPEIDRTRSELVAYACREYAERHASKLKIGKDS